MSDQQAVACITGVLTEIHYERKPKAEKGVSRCLLACCQVTDARLTLQRSQLEGQGTRSPHYLFALDTGMIPIPERALLPLKVW